MMKWEVAPLSSAAVVVLGCGEEPSGCIGANSIVGFKPVLLFVVTLLLLGVPLDQGRVWRTCRLNRAVQPPLGLAAVAVSVWPAFL